MTVDTTIAAMPAVSSSRRRRTAPTATAGMSRRGSANEESARIPAARISDRFGAFGATAPSLPRPELLALDVLAHATQDRPREARDSSGSKRPRTAPPPRHEPGGPGA